MYKHICLYTYAQTYVHIFTHAYGRHPAGIRPLGPTYAVQPTISTQFYCAAADADPNNYGDCPSPGPSGPARGRTPGFF